LSAEFDKSYWINLVEFLLEKDRIGRIVYPKVDHIFLAFHMTPLASIRGLIVGQDPYHGPNQAHGLCFSVPNGTIGTNEKGIDVPSSLNNIYNELCADIPGFVRPSHGCLEKWAKQGLLLLNTALTVTYRQPASHANSGWHHFTQAVIQYLNDNLTKLVFFAWGEHAKSKTVDKIDDKKHLLLTAAHPSGLNKGFNGCKHFSAANAFLITPINWQI
jgi:uracil-DNA glycosylase